MTCKNNLLGGISKIAPWKLLIIWIIYHLPLAPFFCLESDVITGALTTFFGPWSNLEDWSQSWNWWNTNTEGFPGGTVVKNPPANARDARHAGSIPGSGKSLGAGNGNPFQCSWLGNPMDRGAWGGAVHGVAKSRTQLGMHAHIIMGVWFLLTMEHCVILAQPTSEIPIYFKQLFSLTCTQTKFIKQALFVSSFSKFAVYSLLFSTWNKTLLCSWCHHSWTSFIYSFICSFNEYVLSSIGFAPDTEFHVRTQSSCLCLQ